MVVNIIVLAVLLIMAIGALPRFKLTGNYSASFVFAFLLFVTLLVTFRMF